MWCVWKEGKAERSTTNHTHLSRGIQNKVGDREMTALQAESYEKTLGR